MKILEDCGRILTDFGRASGGFRQDLGGSGRISAGLRQEVGWIRRSRADFGGKIADSRGDLVVWPGAASVLARCCLGAGLVEGTDRLNSTSGDFGNFANLYLTRLSPAGGGRIQTLRAFRRAYSVHTPL